jgi:hypothetical protein
MGPIFIVGAQRSGTTMLRLMLNAHPNIAIPFESDFIPKFYRRLEEYGDLSIDQNGERLLKAISQCSFVKEGRLIRDYASVRAKNPRSYSELIAAIYEVYAASEGKPRWGDKDPDYVLQLDVLWSLFPNCRIIHIVRDGRDVANSLRQLGWGSKNLFRLARDWSWQVTLGHKMGMMIGSKYYLEIRYEDLVLFPEQQLRIICDFVDEPFDRKMLHYYKNANRFLPNSAKQYHSNSVQRPDPSKIQAWRREMSVADQAIFEEIAGDTLKNFEYELKEHNKSWASIWMKLNYMTVKRW